MSVCVPLWASECVWKLTELYVLDPLGNRACVFHHHWEKRRTRSGRRCALTNSSMFLFFPPFLHNSPELCLHLFHPLIASQLLFFSFCAYLLPSLILSSVGDSRDMARLISKKDDKRGASYTKQVMTRSLYTRASSWLLCTMTPIIVPNLIAEHTVWIAWLDQCPALRGQWSTRRVSKPFLR